MLKVLIPVDGSDNSSRAVSYVINMAPLLKEPLEIHVLNVQPAIAQGNVKQHIGHEDLNDYYHDEGIAALAPARKVLDAAGVKYTYHIGVGDVGETMAQYVKEKHLQQIVMGTRGLGSVSGMLLGSVASEVIHSTEAPVLLVK